MTPAALALYTPSTLEMAVIVVLIVILFGASKIPELARSVGKAQTEYKKARMEAEEELAEARDALGDEDATEADLASAAEALGIDPEGKSEDELRAAIRDRTGDD